jgi:hypothetical protein
MEKIKFERSYNIKVICNSMDYDVKDFSSYYKGEGVYCFIISSRNEVDDIIKISNNNEFDLSSKEELIEECMEDSEDIEYDYWDEFCESGKIDKNNVEGYFEDIGEEDGRMYFYIVE